MSTNSKIEWTDASWNPTAGCTIVSPGCAHCYAMRMAGRLEKMGQEKYAGTTKKVGKLSVWTGKMNLDEKSLEIPLRWKKPRMIFVNSMSDLFHKEVPFEFIDKVFAVMALCPQHTFQILTKRPEIAAEYLASRTAIGDVPEYEKTPQWYQIITGWLDGSYGGGRFFESESAWDKANSAIEKVDVMQMLPNIWLGTSVENQSRKCRIDELRKCPAAIRFLSLEPLLEELGAVDLTGIDWVITGGESGPGARPMQLDWARSLRDQCKAAGVAFFCKQLSGNGGRAVKNLEDFPADLRIREFPGAKV